MDTADGMYFPPSFSVYLIMGRVVKSGLYSTTSWQEAESTIYGEVGEFIALESL